MLKENAFIMKKYKSLFWAAFLGWVVSLLGGMADSVIAGIYLDSDAVSAVGLITPLSSIIYFVSLIISIGCSIMYSTALGAFEKEKSEKYAGMGVLICVVTGVILCAVVAIFRRQILEFYGCTGILYDYANQYYIPYIVHAAVSPTIWFIYYLVSYDGDGDIILISDIIMAAGNAALSLALVKSMGIFGLSLGTTVSETIGFFAILFHFKKKTNSIKFKSYFSFKDFIKMLQLSSASSLTCLYVGVVDIVFNKFIISRFGEAYLPAYTVVNAVLNIAAVLVCAMNAGSVFVSIAYGEKNVFALKRVMKIVNRDSVIIGAVFSAALFVIAPYWPETYAITDPIIAKASVFAGRVVPLTYIAASLVYAYLEYYPLIDKTFAGNFLAINYMLIGPVVLAIPAGFIWGFNGMTIGFALTPVFAIATEFVYFAVTKQVKNWPILLDNSNEKEAHFDVLLEEENIIEVRDKISEFLKDNDINSKRINEIAIIVEDSLVHIKKKNKKNVLCECDVLLDDKNIRVITKDNGVIFDLMKEAEDSIDLRCYVMARMMESASEKSNTTTISFNRNSYLWSKNLTD